LSNQLTLLEKPVEDIKPNRWITIPEQNEWCEFLSSLGVNVDGLDSCASRWEKYQCASNHDHQKKVRYRSCGKRGVCARDSMGYASQRASLMYQYIKQNLADRLDFDLKLNQIVLTLPESLHDMDTKLFAKMVKEFVSVLGIASYGYCIQTRHSKDPLRGRYVHCHVLSLNMKIKDNRIVEGGYYFDVDEMRNTWKDIIKKTTSVSVEGSVNLHTEYVSVLHDKNKVMHILAYLYRYPIQDLFNVQVRHQTLNYVQCPQFEKNETLDEMGLRLQELRSKVMELIDEKKPRIVWCGLLTSTKRDELMKLILFADNEPFKQTRLNPLCIVQVDEHGKPMFEWKSLSDLEKEARLRAKECRDCGSPLQDQPFETGSYNGDNEPFRLTQTNLPPPQPNSYACEVIRDKRANLEKLSEIAGGEVNGI